MSAGRLELKDWDNHVEQWISRLNCLAQWCPEFELPPLTEEDRRAVVEQICHGAFSYKTIRDKQVKGIVKDWLSDLQKTMLNDHAPERLKLSNGRTPKVKYEENKPPLISLRIQELYDVKETPTVAMGRQPVLIHILAPNMRPHRSPRIWRISGRSTIPRSSRNSHAAIPSTSGAEQSHR